MCLHSHHGRDSLEHTLNPEPPPPPPPKKKKKCILNVLLNTKPETPKPRVARFQVCSPKLLRRAKTQALNPNLSAKALNLQSPEILYRVALKILTSKLQTSQPARYKKAAQAAHTLPKPRAPNLRGQCT